MKIKSCAGWEVEWDSLFKDDEGDEWRASKWLSAGKWVTLENKHGHRCQAMFVTSEIDKAYLVDGVNFYQVR